MTRYAIILSIETYANFRQTDFCHADATLLHTTLVHRCDYAAQHVLTLNLEPNQGQTPTVILDQIKRTVDSSAIGDTILFYFAGHGHRTDDDKTYLILPDTTSVSFEKTALPLADISSLLRLKDRPCFRILDACHSGADVREGDERLDTVGFIRSITHDTAGWVTLAACREDEASISDRDLKQGIFTHYLCDFIRQAQVGEDILPELLKVKVVNQVSEHAKKLRHSQTPTLIASISGNISLATRRAEVIPSEEVKTVNANQAPLQDRIARLRNVTDIITPDYLQQALSQLAESTNKELAGKNDLSVSTSMGNPIDADAIPEWMHRDIVLLAQRQGWHSRHGLKRWEEEVDEQPYPWGNAAIASSLFPAKKRKQVHYDVWQPEGMPKSATIIELAGDGRCVPGVSVLVYVIPMQLKVVLLASAFRRGWPPKTDSLDLLCHSHQVLMPEHPATHAQDLAPFAADRILKKLHQCVAERITDLESELHDK